ncbi:MarC family protein [bacterium]|nr:MarC family protein [bacterium]
MKFLTALDFDFAFVAFSSLFSIINPISTAPIFVSMTEGGIDRKRTAWRTSISAGITLALFAAMGGAIFAFFGITVPAFQIAGGILFTLMSVQTLMDGKPEVPEDTEGADPSIVPLGIPMIAGPGAISTVMVLVGQAQSGFRLFALATAILLNIILTLVILLASPWIVRRLGLTGQKITAKIMGLITLVIGVQFVINGSVSVFTEILKAARS